jgi:RNA polymerase sigma-70 factor (ECF subfamily)
LGLEREAVVLRYWQGCSLAEIAASLDRNESAVAGLIRRGLKYIRTELDGRA